MDETRLREIEGLAADLRPAIAELIAALRDAWRERDFAKDQVLGVVEQRNRDSSEMQHQRERANRAEAEVKRLNDYIPVLLSETFQKHRAVREAAEALLNAFGWDSDFADRHLIGLRRALGAYKRKGEGEQHG